MAELKRERLPCLGQLRLLEQGGAEYLLDRVESHLVLVIEFLQLLEVHVDPEARSRQQRPISESLTCPSLQSLLRQQIATHFRREVLESPTDGPAVDELVDISTLSFEPSNEVCISLCT